MAQNLPAPAKRRGKGKPFQKGVDPRRGSNGGRPKNEQSISHWISEYGNLTPKELAGLCVQYATDLKKVKGDMSMFAHIALRALMGQINEPSPGLFALILDRTEGKVQDRLELSGDTSAPIVLKVVYTDKE